MTSPLCAGGEAALRFRGALPKPGKNPAVQDGERDDLCRGYDDVNRVEVPAEIIDGQAGRAAESV